MIKVITIKYENEIHGKNPNILYDLFLNMYISSEELITIILAMI